MRKYFFLERCARQYRFSGHFVDLGTQYLLVWFAVTTV